MTERVEATDSEVGALVSTSGLAGRVTVDGKFFRVGKDRFYVRGVTYGTFAPNKAGEPFPDPIQVDRDLGQIVELGANTVRIYDVPPTWLLDAAAVRGLRLFVTIPWACHSCFLDSGTRRREARTAVTAAVRALAGHPAVFALALGNEIPPDVVRWSGTPRVAAFLDELACAARDVDPGCLCTYANFPTTEFLQPRALDFLTYNVFLHERRAVEDYLAHLQLLAHDLPLLLGECGADARREGAQRQAEILSHTLEAAVRGGLAGAIVFSFTDDWVRSGVRVADWEMGLTTADRERKPAFAAVQAQFANSRPALSRAPRVSVVVACYNGEATLDDCLDSLLRLDYPDYEIIVVDDGSTDDTPRITAGFPQVRTLRHRTNLGLSTARNLGNRAATGEIIAFTDADCRVDLGWLQFLVTTLGDGSLAGVGGPNLLPSDDSPLAAAVMVSPGGPAHVMRDDRVAEHIPGCNMAFWKWALDAVGGFDRVFHQAGDDVDLCWRLERRGWRLGFSPAAFVWHHRRSSVGAYLRQQAGYGEAEALLIRKHPDRFNAIGGARWQGRICGSVEPKPPWRRDVIYRGVFATGMFQTLYAPAADGLRPLLTSFEYHLLIAVPGLILAFAFGWIWPLVLTAWLVPCLFSILAARRVVIPHGRRRWWSRPLVACLFYIQPVVRGAARHAARLGFQSSPADDDGSLVAQSRVYSATPVRERAYWSSTWRDRREWIERIVGALEKEHWPCRADTGWTDFDVEVFGSRWARVVLVTVAEPNADGSQTLRCRLHSRWTLMAHAIFWVALAVELLIIGLFDVTWKGWWVPVVSQGAIAWFLQRNARVLQCRISVVLDDVAREWNLVHKAPAPAA